MRISEQDFARLLAASRRWRKPRSDEEVSSCGGGRAPRKRSGSSGTPFAPQAPGRSLHLTLPLQPRAKQRPRVFLAQSSARSDTDSDRPTMLAVTPKATRKFERGLRELLEFEMLRLGLSIFQQPVIVGIRAVFPGDGGLAPTSRAIGDLDNLEKAVLDAMNGVVYADDRLVVSKFSQKAFAEASSLTIMVAAAHVDVVGSECFDRVIASMSGWSAAPVAKALLTPGA